MKSAKWVTEWRPRWKSPGTWNPTPSETVTDIADERADRLLEILEDADIDAEYSVEGHVCRDVAFDILHTAREDDAETILMGYPEKHEDIAEEVEYDAPCDVLFVDGFGGESNLDTITVGAGGGPHHQAALSLVNELGASGSDVHVVNGTPSDAGGTAEDIEGTLSNLPDVPTVRSHETTDETVADGLVAAAADHGGVLVIGASRTRLLKRWVFGSTPDRVVKRAEAASVPVIV
ncbi:universal stress protein [Haladaptatus halobius]|uniref:universal stress protein n=1 Tax=Haladaptatus halobius TaxID=2884875 RepID=UPI001D0BAB8E|nr:universal stress protein [Haladaptatus halobius]